MPDKEAPQSLIINTLSAGEIAPALYGRTDLAKFHQSAALMRNFMVDYRGGCVTRPGTQFMGNPLTAGYCRLIPFTFSAAVGQTYMLVLTNQKMEFIKNPGGVSYPNGSNSGFIISGGVHYSIATPWLAADLPFLKFSQVADQMTITRRGYARQILSRISDTSWTLAPITQTTPTAPGQPTVSVTAIPPGSTDPQNTTYGYCVTAVDANGNESYPSPFGGITGKIDIGTTQGTASLSWAAVAGAVYYKVYKALPTPGNVLPPFSSALGFAGYTNGPYFTDPNIVPDFTRSPPSADNPFANGAIIGYTITASSNDWPNPGTTITVTDATGTGAEVLPILGSNVVGSTSGIVGLYIRRGGANYTAPVLTAVGAGGTVFTATTTLSAASGNDPDVVGLFQQRQVYASSINFPVNIWGSRPTTFNDFRKSNPLVDNDAYTFAIAAQQVNNVVWLQSMPGGLVIATNSGIQQLTGGSASVSSPVAVTNANGVVVPQSNYGSADLHPIVIDYDLLYVQSEGSLVRDLQYNLLANIYTGTDITAFSSHLFYPHQILDWAYQDTPFKTVWAAREDGVLLSLAYLKSQEILGWAHHDTQGGLFESVAVVREGVTDAVYFSVNRSGTRYIERLCDRVYGDITDAWCLDCALSTPVGSGVVTTISGLSHLNGLQVFALVNGVTQGPFTVSGGTITINPGGSKVVVGIQYTAQLQTLFADVGGELTIQGKRKKIGAASFRMKDTAGVQYGTRFDKLQLWVQGRSSTDPVEYWPGINVPGLFFGDQRVALDPSFNVTGSVCIQQSQPLPASILAIIPEMAQGDVT